MCDTTTSLSWVEILQEKRAIALRRPYRRDLNRAFAAPERNNSPRKAVKAMSTATDDARQQLVNERLPELQELSNRRSDLLREMFRLVRYGEGSSTSILLDEEDTDDGELERFLDRFDLQKNLQTGSILTLEIPELRLKTGPSREPSPAVGDEERVTEHPPESDDLRHAEDEDGDLQYPTTSPLSTRMHRRGVEEKEEAGVEDMAMDVDVPVMADEPSAPPEREEAPGDVEEEGALKQQVEPQTPPRTRTRTISPIAPRKRKRRRSSVSDEDEPAENVERPQEPSDDSRQTRSKSRKITTPPPAVPDEDKDKDVDVDELDIISLSSASNVSPPRRRTSARYLPSRLAPSEVVSVHEDVGRDEQADVHEDGTEEGSPERADAAKQKPGDEVKFVPASPSTPSVRSPSKSPSPHLLPPEPKEPPIRAPKPMASQIIDSTPLTPPRSPPPPIIVRLPIHQPEKPVYHFIDEAPSHPADEPGVKTENESTFPAPGPERARTSPPAQPKPVKRPALNYTLPPLSALPAEFNRRGKPQKSRKRDKERERSSSDTGKKDDWVPLGMAKWAALLYANPAYKKLGRASKCVSTKDWNTASTELKLIRTLERIDVLKRTGKWSFRQLKKQRVAAGLVKTHWDYLMDEMKWLQVDFREERRWKIALAYELALSVQEWHEAGSYEERIRLGICAPWKRPDPLEVMPTEEHLPMEVDILPAPVSVDEEHDVPSAEDIHTKKSLVDFTNSDNEEDDAEDQRAVTAALIPDTTLDGAQEPFSIPDETEIPSITMKLEEVEGADALHLVESGYITENNQSILQLPQDTVTHWEELPKTEIMDTSQVLKENSNNPTLDSQPVASTSVPEPTQKEQKSLWTPEQAKVLRSSLLSLPEETLFVTMDQFVHLSDEELMKSLAPEGGSTDTPPGSDLSAIFPELQPFSMIDVPNSDIVGGSLDGKKKGDKKADKDDPTRRIEETTYTKLCPTSRFMHMKPTLVSALQPAKKWRKGKWVDLDESPVVSDVDSPPTAPSAENSCTLFEGRRISIPFQPPLMLHNFSKIPRNTVKAAEIPWSPAEDNMLKNLAERYPSNWRLVADALNSSRIRTSIDLRTPQECFERWRSRCGVSSRPMLPSAIQPAASFLSNEEGAASQSIIGVDTPPPPTPSAPVNTPQMTTRGVKRLATSAAQNVVNLTVNTGAATVESRKRKRHFIIYEAVRKTLAKRQKQRKQDEIKYQTSSASIAPVHDTHHQFGTKIRYTPLELSQMKAERERKEFDLQLVRRREMEAKRQQQQQQLHAQLQQAQQQQQMGQQGVALPQNVPQIRTQVGISQHQQQKLPTQVGSVPVSPQMMQQAQAAQQARALAQAQAQAQVQSQPQQPQTQPSHPQMQGQMASAQTNMNGAVPHLSAPYINHGGASSPVAQHSSPPRSAATPVNSVATFPRPPSAQRNVAMQGPQVLPMTSGSVPIARTNNALAAYFANSGVQYTPEQMTQLMRYQQAQQAQQAAQQQQLQMQQQQQQQQPMQVQVQPGQQNSHQGGMTGYPPTGQ